MVKVDAVPGALVLPAPGRAVVWSHSGGFTSCGPTGRPSKDYGSPDSRDGAPPAQPHTADGGRCDGNPACRTRPPTPLTAAGRFPLPHLPLATPSDVVGDGEGQVDNEGAPHPDDVDEDINKDVDAHALGGVRLHRSWARRIRSPASDGIPQVHVVWTIIVWAMERAVKNWCVPFHPPASSRPLALSAPSAFT